MTGSFALLKQRRFLPLFVTQLLGAFNDNLFKNAMVLFVVYGVFNDEASETLFSAVATGLFILPFFLLSALAGQLADTRDNSDKELREYSSRVQCAVDCYGPVDLQAMMQSASAGIVRQFIGKDLKENEEAYRAASPIAARAPPMHIAPRLNRP